MLFPTTMELGSSNDPVPKFMCTYTGLLNA